MQRTILAIAAISTISANGRIMAQAVVDHATFPPEPAFTGRITFESTTHDFGRVNDRSPLIHRFLFTNTGAGTLSIRDRGRMIPPRSAHPPFDIQWDFAPGERGMIEFNLDTHGKRGPLEIRPSFPCNDPTYGTEGPRLSVRAFVRPSIKFEPASIDFGEILAGETGLRTLAVVGDCPEFAVMYLSTSKGRFIKWSIVKHDVVVVDGEPAGRTTIQLELDTANLKHGPVYAVGMIRTNQPEYWLADFPLTCTVVGDIRVVPSRLNLGTRVPREFIQRTVKVESRTGTPFSISDIVFQEGGTPPFDIGCVPVTGMHGAAYFLTVSGEVGATGADFKSTVLIHTDSVSQPPLELSVSGAVRKGVVPLIQARPSKSAERSSGTTE